MKTGLLLTVGLLAATTAAGQERPMVSPVIMLPGTPVAAEEPELEVADIATRPRPELSADDLRALDEARDIRRLKTDLTALRQALQSQQGEIEQLRECLKLHDQKLAGKPLAVRSAVGSGSALATSSVTTTSQFATALADSRICKSI